MIRNAMDFHPSPAEEQGVLVEEEADWQTEEGMKRCVFPEHFRSGYLVLVITLSKVGDIRWIIFDRSYTHTDIHL